MVMVSVVCMRLDTRHYKLYVNKDRCKAGSPVQLFVDK